jgi:long-chain acyl-CoA synthetase
LRKAAEKYPSAPACVMSAHLPALGRQRDDLSYRELDEQSDALAVALSDMGVKKGDRVAIIMPNCTQFVIAFFGILKAGAIVCATNPTYPALKMQEQLQDCGANTAITMSLFYNMLKGIQANTSIKNVIVTNIKEYLPPLAAFLFTVAKEKKGGHRIEKAPNDHALPDLLRRYKGRKLGVEVSKDDPAIFQYTGGTTGVPKAAVSSHYSLVVNTLQCRAVLEAGQTASNERPIFMAAIPLFHVFGMISVMGLAVTVAGSMLMVPNPRDIKDVLEVIHAYQPTFYMGVPAMYNAINNNPEVVGGKFNIRSIKACISGSAPLPPATKKRFEELTGGKLVEGYGMSEAPTAFCVNPLHGENRTGSIGLPLPDVEMRVVSLDDEVTDLAVGDVGELVVHSPHLMMHYHNKPNETNIALRTGPDGRKWLYTGDIGKMDPDGYFYIVDRKKDMAIIGGFNVYPTNVEKVFAEHPAVMEAAVAKIPHPEKEGQEALKAWIIIRPGMTVSETELIDFASKKLARYELPTRIQFTSELPRTTVGKVLRRELVEKHQEEVAAIK